MPDHDFDIPELNRIGELMRDVGDGPAARPAVRPARKAGPARFRLAGVTVAAFGEGVNWANDAAFKSPLFGSNAAPARRLAALTVAAFAAGANWANAIGAPPLLSGPADDTPVAPPPTLDSFMSEFAWD